jgi:2-phosphosulfolactate phosphatase
VEILRANLATCGEASDLVVAIDVLRAFTTAGYLFQSGVEEILLVSGVQEAFDLRDQHPGYLLLGEVDGVQVPGFDLGNSPSQIAGKDLSGRKVIQRTTTGTQAVALAVQAKTILTAALTNLTATARLIQQLGPQRVALVQSGYFPEEGWGDEDVACADAIEAILIGRAVDVDSIRQRVRNSRSGRHYDGRHAAFPPADLELALRFDCFHFAMVVDRGSGRSVLRRQPVAERMTSAKTDSKSTLDS